MAIVIIVACIALCSSSYVALAMRALGRFRQRLEKFAPTTGAPPVTLLKPIYRGDPELLENLRSCCRQDYPVFQIIFGFRHADDSAIPVVRRIIEEFPEHDLLLLVDDGSSGPNLKASSLANMERHAKHDILIVADSDMRVPSDYLRRVALPFSDPAVGAVTCPYRGTPTGGLASKLGALFVNEWFLPSVLVAERFRPLRYCLGATMAVRRGLLAKLGGFAALARYLADDYMLGKRVAELGARVELAPCLVENIIEESSFAELWRHELRWARTMRSMEPAGYAAAVLTDVTPMFLALAITILAVTLDALLAAAILALGLLIRWLLHVSVASNLPPSEPTPVGALVTRDFLNLALRVWSFVPGPVMWRGHRYSLRNDGTLVPRDTPP